MLQIISLILSGRLNARLEYLLGPFSLEKRSSGNKYALYPIYIHAYIYFINDHLDSEDISNNR